MAFQLAPFLARSVPGVGVLGGIVGGAAALAEGLKAKERGEVDSRQVAASTVKEAAGAGAATAFSAFAAGLVGGGLVVSLATAFTAAVAGKYVWDRGMDCLQEKYGETEA
ncbi:MAG: magnetosome protein MamC [Rhodospirillales bacterium]